MALPTFVAAGTYASGTGTVEPGLPGGIANNDILTLVIEAEGEGSGAAAAPSGGEWTLIGYDESDTNSFPPTTRCTVYWHRYDGSTDPNRTVPDAGDHTSAIIAAWNGCLTTASPIHQVQVSSDDSANTSGSATGVTTTVDDCLIVIAGTHGDNVTVSGVTNASLSDLTEHVDQNHLDGTDGHIHVFAGGLASFGASGTTTWTVSASEEDANVVFALEPAAAVTANPKGPLGMPLHGPFGGPI